MNDKQRIEKLLQDLKDNSPKTTADTVLGTLDWRDFPALCHAQAMLALKAKDHKLDVVFWAYTV